VILLLIISLASVFIFHASSLKEYKHISNTLILENTLSTNVADYIEAFSAVSVAPTSKERLQDYSDKREDILATFKELDTVIVSDESRVTYQGLKNIILGLVSDLENGKELVMQGDVVGADKFYTQAVSKKPFVETNVTLLVIKELEYLDEIKSSIEEKYQEQLFRVTLWILVTIAATLFYALIFSRKITSPIKALSSASQQVTAGDYSTRIAPGLLAGEDEVGKLAEAINFMLITINSKITEVEAANSAVLVAKQHLEERNDELEKFNHMIIGRELKMIQLKEKIASLEALVAQK
jgi:methyl-accepting chemotaxis protein